MVGLSAIGKEALRRAQYPIGVCAAQKDVGYAAPLGVAARIAGPGLDQSGPLELAGRPDSARRASVLALVANRDGGHFLDSGGLRARRRRRPTFEGGGQSGVPALSQGPGTTWFSSN
jgi:hypothetical protein